MLDLVGTPVELTGMLAATPRNGVLPKVGELWLLSWDRSFLGLACIAEIHDDFVSAWPVTLPAEASFAPALMVPLADGPDLCVWPTRETGIGNHLLDRRLGELLPGADVDDIAINARRGLPTLFTYATGSGYDPENVDADHRMVGQWQALCFHEWPPVGRDVYLSDVAIKKAGGSARGLSDVLGLDQVAARALWLAHQPATAEQASAIADALGIDAAAITSPDPSQDFWTRLNTPLYKGEVVARASQLGVPEGEMRDLARSDFALAARDDTSQLTDAKVRDAIRRAKLPA